MATIKNRKPRWFDLCREPYCVIHADALWFAADTQAFEMPAHGREARFANIEQAVEALRSVYGSGVVIRESSAFNPLYGTRRHVVSGCGRHVDGSDVTGTNVAIIEYLDVQYTSDLDKYSAPTYRLK